MKQLFFLIAFFMIFSSQVFSQNHWKEPHQRKVNFGIKGGFNSSMYLVDKFKIKDVTIDEIQNNYKVGYFGAVFLRLNFKRHFIQPEFIYSVSKCEIIFDKKGSQHPDIEPDYASINCTLRWIELPVMYGYHFIRSGRYGMSFFVGPKFKYIWKQRSKLEFSNFDQKGINEELYPFNISAVIGLGVNISNIFFDFRYELGIHNISKSVIYDNISPSGEEQLSTMIFDRRCNVLSFSLGVIF